MTNIQGTSVLLQALRNSKGAVGKVVLASSRAVYGEGLYHCEQCADRFSPTPRNLADLQAGSWELTCENCSSDMRSLETLESAQFRPGSIYASSKATQEYLMECVCNSLDIGFNALRYFNVYGEGQALSNPYTGILTTFITQIMAGRSISVYEDGLESRDFVHIDDVVKANVLALEAMELSGAFNIGSGDRTTILETAELISRLCNSTASPKITGEFRYGDIRHCIADTHRAESILGYKSTVDLEVGLQRFIDWARPQNPTDNTDIAHRELADRGLLGVGGTAN